MDGKTTPPPLPRSHIRGSSSQKAVDKGRTRRRHLHGRLSPTPSQPVKTSSIDGRSEQQYDLVS